MGVAVKTIVQIDGAMKRNTKNRSQIAAGEWGGSIACKGDVVGGPRSGIRAAEAAVIAVPGNCKTRGRADDNAGTGSVKRIGKHESNAGDDYGHCRARV